MSLRSMKSGKLENFAKIELVKEFIVMKKHYDITRA